MSKKNQLKKKLQYGSISIVLVVVFIAAIALANLGVSFLTDRFNLKLDISAEGLYSISDQTETMLKNLDEPVVVYILLSEAEVMNTNGYAQANELLHRFENLSGGNFTVEYVDIYKNPTFTQNYPNESLSQGSIIIESETRYKVMALVDLYEIGTSYDSSTGSSTQYISGFAADQAFASGLHYVTTADLPTVVMVTGHNEQYDSAFIELFSSNNYNVVETNIAMEEIPANTDLLLVGTPSGDYSEAEIAKLDAYLNENGGNAIVFTDVTAPDMPVFERYFTEWGVEYEKTMICDSSRAYGYPEMVVPYIMESSLTEDLSFNTNSILIAPQSRGMNVLWEERGSRTTEVVLASSQSSYAKSYADGTETLTSLTKEEGDAEGPFPMGVLSTQKKYVNNQSVVSKVLFMPTSYVTSSAFLNQQSLFNKRFLVSAMNYMNPVVDAISIEAKEFTDTSLVILAETQTTIMVTLVIVIPLLILAMGTFVWIRRKNK